MRRLRAAFDKPTTLALLGGISLPVGLAVMLGDGVGIAAFGVECLAAAILTTTRR